MFIGNYRHEYKYLIYSTQMSLLKIQAKSVMQPDFHAKNGSYNIRSLYFDDYYNSYFYDNENGNDPREKFRIRIYNHSDSRISLECKKKVNGKTLKESCLITKDQCQQLMQGKIIDDYLRQDELIKIVCSRILNCGLKPVEIIEYERIPFVYRNGNVRVTFDTNISSSNYIHLFLNKDIPKRSILPVGLNLMEVKYDELLPDIIYNSMQLDNLTVTNFSKYYLGRRYEIGKNLFIK